MKLFLSKPDSARITPCQSQRIWKHERFQKSICEIYTVYDSFMWGTGPNFDGAFWLTVVHFHSMKKNNSYVPQKKIPQVSCDMKVSRWEQYLAVWVHCPFKSQCTRLTEICQFRMKSTAFFSVCVCVCVFHSDGSRCHSFPPAFTLINELMEC